MRAFGVPPGLGSHVSAGQRLDGRLAAAMLSIQSAKGVEIGDAIASAGRRGSSVHDEILAQRRAAATTARPTAPAGSRAASPTAPT